MVKYLSVERKECWWHEITLRFKDEIIREWDLSGSGDYSQYLNYWYAVKWDELVRSN